jgi:hypothetical protein
MINEELYQQYDSNPTEWMKEHDCATSKDVILKLMNQATFNVINIMTNEDSLKTSFELLKELAIRSNYYPPDKNNVQELQWKGNGVDNDFIKILNNFLDFETGNWLKEL